MKIKPIQKIVPHIYLKREIQEFLASQLMIMWQLCILENEGKQANRSSTKTDSLHVGIGEAFLRAMGHFRVQFEDHFLIRSETHNSKGKTQRIKVKDIRGKDFNVDIIVADKISGDIKMAILAKGQMTSINKNSANYQCNAIGEVNRFFGNNQNSGTILTLINAVPTSTYKKQKDDTLVWETVASCTIDEKINTSERDVAKTYLELSCFTDKVKAQVRSITLNYDWQLIDPENTESTSYMNVRSIKTLGHLEKVLKYNIEKKHNFLQVTEGSVSSFCDVVIDFVRNNQSKEGFSEMIQCSAKFS
jgi:hypothetical protein